MIRVFTLALIFALAAPFSFANEPPATSDSPMNSAVRIQSIEGFRYAFVSQQTTLRTIQDAIAKLMPQLDAGQATGKLRRMGPVVFTYHNANGKPDAPFTLDVGVGIDAGSAVPPGFTVVDVPASRCATIVHFGSTSKLMDSYMKLFTEIDRRGLKPTPICRELYLIWNGPDSPNNIIQIQAELAADASPSTSPASNAAPVNIEGGNETDPRDRGRPVVLVAAGLNVSPEVFRDAFSKVKPAGPGRSPTEAEARRNKDALLGALAKYGVTNDRLDEVSNFYRYRRENNELWKHQPAKLKAIIRDGKVADFRIDDAGYGYSSSPTISVEGFPDVKAEVKLHFDTDLMKNGSIESVTIAAR